MWSETEGDANDYLAAARNRTEEGGDLKLESAKMLLLRELHDGWRLLSDIHRVREKENIGETTLKRARQALGIIYTKKNVKPCKIALPGTLPEIQVTGVVDDQAMANTEVL